MSMVPFTLDQHANLHCKHSCITAAAFYVYNIVNETDVVRSTWIPWKDW